MQHKERVVRGLGSDLVQCRSNLIDCRSCLAVIVLLMGYSVTELKDLLVIHRVANCEGIFWLFLLLKNSK